MNPHRLLNEVGANYSAYRIRSFVGVLTRHLMNLTSTLVGHSFSGYGLPVKGKTKLLLCFL